MKYDKCCLATQCCMSKGIGRSINKLPSFDKALVDAGVGNYNLVRLSSILPAKHEWVDVGALPSIVDEGSLLPVAYSTITSDVVGDSIVSSIGVGICDDKHVGVIMEYSDRNVSKEDALNTLHDMIKEAFDIRGWELNDIKSTAISACVEVHGEQVTTFACIAEW